MTRTLRPVVLAGYLVRLATLLGASAGGTEWALAGLLSTLAVLLRDQGRALDGLGGGDGARRGLDRPGAWRMRCCCVTSTSTACLRCTPCCWPSGPATPPRTLSAVSSVGTSWRRGFAGEDLGGTDRRDDGDYRRHLLRALRAGFLDRGVARARRVIAIVAPLGDLFESALKRECRGEGHRAGSSGATAACSTASTRFSSPGWSPTTSCRLRRRSNART